MSTAADVTVIGAGAMGSAIAHALLAAGQNVTVWNRTREKLEPLRDAGAVRADSLPGAVGRTPVSVMCVSDQTAVAEVMDAPGVIEALRGRTLLQLTTGTALDGRRGKAFAQDHGIKYLTGALMAYPRSIGTSAAVILCAGEKPNFYACEPILSALGAVRYIGDDTGRPAAIDAALIAFFYGALAGFLHGAALARAEEIPMNDFLELALPYFRGFIAEAVAETGERLLTRDYSVPQSSMHTHLGGVDKLVIGASQAASVEHQMMSAIKGVFLRAIAEGRGDEDIASVIEVLRQR